MAFPVLWYLWCSVMLFDPRTPEERMLGYAIGRPFYRFRGI